MGVAAVLIVAALTAPKAIAGATTARTSAAHAGSAAQAYDESLCQSRSSLCIDTYDNPAGEYVGHDEPSLEFKSAQPGSGNDMTYTMTLPEGAQDPAHAAGTGGDVELPAPPDVLVRPDPVRHASPRPSTRRPARRTPTPTTWSAPNPTAPDYIGKHPGNALHGTAVLRPRLRAPVRGLRLHRAPVLRRHDDRQPHPRTRTPASRTPPPATTTSSAARSRSTGPTSPRAAPRRRPANPLFTGTFASPNLSAVNPNLNKDLLMSPGDRIRIHMHDTAGRLPRRPDRPHHRAERFDDRIDGQRVRAHPVQPDVEHVPGAAVRLPPRVLHRRPARQHVVRAHLQRRDVRRDRPLRELHPARRRRSTAPCPATRTPAASTRTTAASASPAATRPWSRSTAASAPTRTSTAQSYRNDWPGTDPNPSRTRLCTRRRCCSPARWPTARPNYSTIAFETDLPGSRPPTRRPRRSATAPPGRTASTRPGRAVLPVLHHPSAAVPVPGRRAAGSSRARRTPSAAARRPSSGRCCKTVYPAAGSRRSPVQQLQQRRHAEPLPGPIGDRMHRCPAARRRWPRRRATHNSGLRDP